MARSVYKYTRSFKFYRRHLDAAPLPVYRRRSMGFSLSDTTMTTRVCFRRGKYRERCHPIVRSQCVRSTRRHNIPAGLRRGSRNEHARRTSRNTPRSYSVGRKRRDRSTRTEKTCAQCASRFTTPCIPHVLLFFGHRRRVHGCPRGLGQPLTSCYGMLQAPVRILEMHNVYILQLSFNNFCKRLLK